jgi:energy-converting hydrogenase Eha subunit G
MLEIIRVAIAVAIIAGAYTITRRFVRERLRFVDAAQRPGAPWIAAGIAALVAVPAAWLLPLVSAGTGLVAAAAVGFGVAAGARDVRKGSGMEIARY